QRLFYEKVKVSGSEGRRHDIFGNGRIHRLQAGQPKVSPWAQSLLSAPRQFYRGDRQLDLGFIAPQIRSANAPGSRASGRDAVGARQWRFDSSSTPERPCTFLGRRLSSTHGYRHVFLPTSALSRFHGYFRDFESRLYGEGL